MTISIRSRKQAQMEILGLALVVSLIVIAGMLVFIFGRETSQKDAQKAFADTQLSTTFLSALMKTSTGCRGTQLSDLLVDCADNSDINRQVSPLQLTCSFSDGTTKDSCEYSQEIVTRVLEKTLDKWKIVYVLKVVQPGNYGSWPEGVVLGQAFSPLPMPQPGVQKCPRGQELEEFFYPSSHGQVKVSLAICN